MPVKAHGFGFRLTVSEVTVLRPSATSSKSTGFAKIGLGKVLRVELLDATQALGDGGVNGLGLREPLVP